MDYVTSESTDGEVEVRVEILFGQLERSIAIWVNSTQNSTASPNQGNNNNICYSFIYEMAPHHHQG